jgi:murein DD-endopeptidase MepM/ murein hydrolase activator NlpD
MRYVQGKIRTLLAQQSGQIQLLIIAPILTLSFLSLVVRTANSAIDPSLEKKKVNQQLKQRLLEVRGADPQRRPDSEARVQHDNAQSMRWTLAKGEATYLGVEAARNKQPATSAQQAFALNPAAAIAQKKKLSSETQGKKLMPTWELAQESDLRHTSLAYIPTANKPNKKTSSLVKIDNTEEIKKAIADTQAKKPAQSPVVTAALAPVPLPAPVPVKKEEVLPFPPSRVIHTIKKKETLEKIFNRIGIPSKEAAKWVSAAKKNDAFRNLRPNQTLELNFIEDSFNLHSVVYEIEAGTRAILERKAKDSVKVRLEEPPIQQVLFVLGGKIGAGFTKTLRKAGLPARISDGVARLAWDVDLSDLRKRDSFKVLVEAVQKGEKIVTYKRLLAAEVNHDEMTYSAFSIPEERLLRKKKERVVRYQGEGLNIESEGEKFLRFPLEFTRISSMFAGSRLHPILHRSRPHNGIDFAAPRGTPVRSVASGTVMFVGRQSGYGNLVKVDHPGPYETGYAHLQDYAEGIFEGTAIERGQVIGYVGSTGLATGPHLHFELYKDGEFVNPFGESAIETASVVEEIEEEEPPVVDPIIEEKKRRLSERLAALEVGGQQLTSLVIPLQEGPAATGIATNPVDRPEATARRSQESVTR